MEQLVQLAPADLTARVGPAMRRAKLRSVSRGGDCAAPRASARPQAAAGPACPAATAEAEPAELVPMLLDTWRLIDAALVPVIGHGGAHAFYQRSLQLAACVHPWLGTAGSMGLASRDATAWQATLAAQGATEATISCGTLLLAADRLLASLVGVSLSQRLLQPVWEASLLHPARS